VAKARASVSRGRRSADWPPTGVRSASDVRTGGCDRQRAGRTTSARDPPTGQIHPRPRPHARGTHRQVPRLRERRSGRRQPATLRRQAIRRGTESRLDSCGVGPTCSRRRRSIPSLGRDRSADETQAYRSNGCPQTGERPEREDPRIRGFSRGIRDRGTSPLRGARERARPGRPRRPGRTVAPPPRAPPIASRRGSLPSARASR
jgi:hypothetical protein